jgi:GATA-binding protein, other eukaryote
MNGSDNFPPGLYYKLHGRHRPSGMKKGEIKRRKRVMPAMLNQPMQFDSSVSPDPNIPTFADAIMTSSEQARSNTQTSLPLHDRHQSNGHVLEPEYRSFGPPPVDFTSYSNPSRDAPASRKRTHRELEGISPTSHHLPTAPPSATTAEDPHHRRTPPSTATEAFRASTDSAIDPSLAAFASAAANAANAVGGAESREQVKARLRMERERMKQSLRAVEMELERMEHD